MLKSLCCFAFISAFILAVHSQNDTAPILFNPTNAEVVIEKGTPDNAKNETVLINEVGNSDVDVKPPVDVNNSTSTSKNIKAGHCITCNQTSSEYDTICLDPLRNETSKHCDNHNENQCYIKFSLDGFITRGCADELSTKDLHQCKSKDNCTICNNDNCNNFIFPEKRLSCHICNASNKNCSENFSKVAPKLCPKYVPNEKCFIANDKGSYERGCMSGTRRCREPEKCMECKTDGCNNGYYNSANGQYSVATMISFMFFSFTMVLVNK